MSDEKIYIRMKTKIVYSIVSDSSDIFLEQLLVSLYSLRMHNPQVHVTVVMDKNTKDTLVEDRTECLKYIDETIVVDVPEDYSKKMRSRFIKTQLRKYVTGDILFIDSDTVITCPLDDIDEIIKQDADIYMVLDEHTTYSKHNSPYIDKLKKIGWDYLYKSYQPYYNSGVMLMKDNDSTRKFSELWYNNWLFECTKGFVFDQLALFYTLSTNNFSVRELPGEWNCQINRDCTKYLGKSKIIHYFNSRSKVSIYPSAKYFLYGEQPFIDIKGNGGRLTEDILYGLSHPKSTFVFPDVTDVVSCIKERESDVHSLFLSKPRLWRILEYEASLMRRIGFLLRKLDEKWNN